MSDLVAWLREQLDEDERRTQAMEHRNIDDGGYYSCPATRAEGEDYGDLPSGEAHCDCELAARRKRMLAEVGSKRRIIDLHGLTVEKVSQAPFDPFTGERTKDEFEVTCELCGWASADPSSGCETLRAMTLPYVDRPGYDPTWSPEA